VYRRYNNGMVLRTSPPTPVGKCFARTDHALFARHIGVHDCHADHCRVYEQPVTELSANPSTAFVQAQALVAQWMDKHPGFTLDTWRLEPGRGA